jgi:hypothetical protein
MAVYVGDIVRVKVLEGLIKRLGDELLDIL